MNKDTHGQKLAIQHQMVSPEPEIFIHKRKEGDEFILIACDGVFDVLSNEDACFHVRQVRIKKQRPPPPRPPGSGA